MMVREKSGANTRVYAIGADEEGAGVGGGIGEMDCDCGSVRIGRCGKRGSKRSKAFRPLPP